MCYGNAAKSLEIARSRLSPEQWAKFEREFEDFCAYSGLMIDTTSTPANRADSMRQFDWAKWAFFQGRGYSDRTADQRVADAKYTRLAIAMMSGEQAQMSLGRWEQVNLERGA